MPCFLQNLVAPAVDKTIRETIRVVDHAVSIAVTTSHELVTKDFISEPDVGRLTSAAHSLVGNLAASLVRMDPVSRCLPWAPPAAAAVLTHAVHA